MLLPLCQCSDPPSFFADLVSARNLNADPDLDPGCQSKADLDPGLFITRLGDITKNISTFSPLFIVKGRLHAFIF